MPEPATNEAAENQPEQQALPTPEERAQALRDLPDAELLALADEAANAAALLDRMRRAQAEFENTIKRLRRDHEDAFRYASSGLARDLLPVLDNLARAIGAAEASKDFDGLFKGLELTKKMFEAALERNDIKPIDALGKPFDPACHDAVMTANDSKLGDNVVATEMEQGWTLRDRVLRASKVAVNQKPAEQKPAKPAK
jgi:molecular chaperone GrpE